MNALKILSECKSCRTTRPRQPILKTRFHFQVFAKEASTPPLFSLNPSPPPRSRGCGEKAIRGHPSQDPCPSQGPRESAASHVPALGELSLQRPQGGVNPAEPTRSPHFLGKATAQPQVSAHSSGTRACPEQWLLGRFSSMGDTVAAPGSWPLPASGSGLKGRQPRDAELHPRPRRRDLGAVWAHGRGSADELLLGVQGFIRGRGRMPAWLPSISSRYPGAQSPTIQSTVRRGCGPTPVTQRYSHQALRCGLRGDPPRCRGTGGPPLARRASSRPERLRKSHGFPQEYASWRRGPGSR